MDENDYQRDQSGKEIALEARQADAARLFSPSVAKNKMPLGEAFGKLLPPDASVLEIASGTGEHGYHLCTSYPKLRWQPSDPDPSSRASVAAWAEHLGTGQMAAPLNIRTDIDGWWAALNGHQLTALVCINMIHIAPWSACEGLFQGAAALLSPGDRLFLYGPFKRRGCTADSNMRFDADLKRRDPSWGVRDLDDQLQPLGARYALHLADIIEMPGNNLSVAFEKG